MRRFWAFNNMAKEVEFCTADELATRLRVTKATIYRMARRGELPYYSIGRAMRFRSQDVDEFLKRCRGVGEETS